MTRVGILALQGDVAEHAAMLQRCGVEPVKVRRPSDLADLDALVLPGGESTTIGKLAVEYGLVEPLRGFVASGKPVWGTCAGLILLARDAGHAQPLVGGLDVRVERNAFGRQVDSFETDLEIVGIDGGPFHAVFIRAPAIAAVGPGVEVLARLDEGRADEGQSNGRADAVPAGDGSGDGSADHGRIVAVRQGHILGTAFHAELGEDLRWHRLFLGLLGRG
jgi:5'-phosphate synthase pdxT subunit